MKLKPYQLRFAPPWEKNVTFGRRPKLYTQRPAKIVANPGVVMKVLRRKKVIAFLAYFLLVALTMLNLANYRWTKDPQQCNHEAHSTRLQPRTDVRFLFKEPPVKARQIVYVLTTWRSGSSFFGELFNQNPGVFFLYEPMWHIWQKLYPGDAVSLQGAARDMLNSLYRCDFSVFQLYGNHDGRNITTLGLFGGVYNKVICSYPLCSAYRKDVVAMVDENVCKKCPSHDIHLLEQECLKYNTIVIKGVRIMDINVLAPLMEDPSLNLKVIHLVRDPRAVANSRINSKQGLIRENMQVVRSRNPKVRRSPLIENGVKDGFDYNSVSAMEVSCENIYQTLKAALNPPRWLKGKYLMVRYEDLVDTPIKTLQRMYGFINMTVSRDIEAFVMNMTKGNSSTYEPFIVSSRNATKAAYAWRTVLSYKQVKQVEDFCAQAMNLLGYLRTHSPVEVKDLKKALMTVPKV